MYDNFGAFFLASFVENSQPFLLSCAGVATNIYLRPKSGSKLRDFSNNLDVTKFVFYVKFSKSQAFKIV
jgi:hypothetical protein